jgi:hypothetical protein
VPRLAASGTQPTWDALYGVAVTQAGYFSSIQAADASYSPQLLQHHLKKGRVRRVGRGLWRLAHFPASEHEDLVPIWLWSEGKGVFGHETALVLHGLSDVLPEHTFLTLPLTWSRRRLQAPRLTLLSFADVAPAEVTWSGPVPVTSPLRTLQDCVAAHLPKDLIRQAVGQGMERGLLRQAEGKNLLSDLDISDTHDPTLPRHSGSPWSPWPSGPSLSRCLSGGAEADLPRGGPGSRSRPRGSLPAKNRKRPAIQVVARSRAGRLAYSPFSWRKASTPRSASWRASSMLA